MRLIHDGEFHYPGHFGKPAECWLRAWAREPADEFEPARDGAESLVVAVELPTNPGTSVTNRAGPLAALACERLGLDPAGLVLVEHYPRDAWPERFRRIAFGGPGPFEGPHWSKLDRATVERIAGQRWADVPRAARV